MSGFFTRERRDTGMYNDCTPSTSPVDPPSMNPDLTYFADEIADYVGKGTPYLSAAKTAAANDPTIIDIRFDPVSDRLFVRRTHESPFGEKIAGLETVYGPVSRMNPDPCWCALVLTKNASLRETLQGLTGWTDRYYSPSPLAAMIATGVLGAGLGYGGATLASSLLPGKWDKRKFRRSGLQLGAGLGALPGAIETMKSLMIGQPITDGSHMRSASGQEKVGDARHLPHSPRYSAGPTIDSDAMIHTIWRSPMVSGNLTSKERSLFTGAMLGARQIARSPQVTPTEMARLAAGMGSGYAAGLVAGKVLGTLTGMPSEVQNSLARTGMYAGIVKATLPMIYGVQ